VTQQNAASADEIASTAGTLASQAEHLQRTIEFFKIGEMISQSTKTMKPLGEPIQPKPSPTNVADNKTHPKVEKDTGQREETSSEYLSDLNQPEESRDDRDAEFERY
jgi:hypothetical protein